MLKLLFGWVVCSGRNPIFLVRRTRVQNTVSKQPSELTKRTYYWGQCRVDCGIAPNNLVVARSARPHTPQHKLDRLLLRRFLEKFGN